MPCGCADCDCLTTEDYVALVARLETAEETLADLIKILVEEGIIEVDIDEDETFNPF